MAEFKGRRCDREGCTTVVENVHTTPGGWVKMIPVVNGDTREAENTKEFCSEYCHAVVAVERYESTVGKKLVRTPRNKASNGHNEARVEGGRRAAHTRNHTNKGVVEPGCEYCINDTSPGVKNEQEEKTT